MMWGKAPYEQPGSIPRTSTSRRSSDFPGPGDVDGNGDGKFNTDHFNGGIAGIVHYGITRAENDPRWAAAENWEPGVSDVRVQLWDENRTHLLNEVHDRQLEQLAAGRAASGRTAVPYVYHGPTPTDCFDGLRNFNQARPALFDGGYAFSTILVDSYDPARPKAMTFNNPISLRRPARAVHARGRAREPDPRRPVRGQDHRAAGLRAPEGRGQERRLRRHVRAAAVLAERATRWPTPDGGPGEAQPAPTVEDNALIAPFCVGQLHEVPDDAVALPRRRWRAPSPVRCGRCATRSS